MKPLRMRRPMNCMATAVAAMLEIDEDDLPWTGGDDWPAAWAAFRTALAERGWRITRCPYDEAEISVADILASVASDDDAIERDLLWLVSCTHPSFGDDYHVLVTQAGAIVFDPSPTTPPAGELLYKGGFLLTPIDPARFVYRGPLEPLIHTPAVAKSDASAA